MDVRIENDATVSDNWAVPHEENPIATVEIVKEWIQPIMLSNDQVDESRPFSVDNKMRLNQSSIWGATYEAWHAFSPSSERWDGWAAKVKDQPENWLEMKLIKPTCISQVLFKNRNLTQNNIGTIHLLADTKGNGSFEEIASGNFPEDTVNITWTFDVPPSKQGFFKTYRLRHTGCSAGAYISRGLKITAVYKSWNHSQN